MNKATTIPVSEIYTLPEFNPRRHFDEAALDELADSISRRGLIQPITVRLAESDAGKYHLVAGERRFRAAKKAGLTEVLAVVRACSLDEARKIALEENDHRADITAGEEAVAAQKVLDDAEGDRTAAAKELGWSRSKLDSRLLLLHAVPEVIDALASGKIMIGHAEHLAGLPEATQQGTLEKVIADNISVSDLRQRLATFSIPLTQACFATEGCNGCSHNTAGQLGLFSDPLDGANCLNRECFAAKTRAALEARKSELADDFNVVVLATEKPDDDVRAVTKDGGPGVGPEQFAACLQCAHYGARVEDRLNGNTGKVTGGLCFNRTCNDEKRAAFQAALAEVRGQGASGSDTPAADAQGNSRTSKTASRKNAGKSTKAAELPKGAKAVVSESVRTRVGQIVQSSEQLQKALSVESMIRRLGHVDAADCSFFSGLPDEDTALLKGGSATGLKDFTRLLSLPVARLDAMLVALATAVSAVGDLASTFDSTGYHRAQFGRALAIAAAAATQRSTLFTVDEAFLAKLPKAAIAALLTEVKFDAWYIERHDEKAYKALLASKKSDLPKKIMDAGFEWQGKTPKLVESLMKEVIA